MNDIVWQFVNVWWLANLLRFCFWAIHSSWVKIASNKHLKREHCAKRILNYGKMWQLQFHWGSCQWTIKSSTCLFHVYFNKGSHTDLDWNFLILPNVFLSLLAVFHIKAKKKISKYIKLASLWFLIIYKLIHNNNLIKGPSSYRVQLFYTQQWFLLLKWNKLIMFVHPYEDSNNKNVNSLRLRFLLSHSWYSSRFFKF